MWTAQQLAQGSHDYTKAASEGHPLACTLLGVQSRDNVYAATPDGLLSLLDGATDQRAQVITLGLVLAAAEQATGLHSWRNPTRTTTAYLTFPADHGYTCPTSSNSPAAPSPNQTRVGGATTARRPTSSA